MCHISLLFYGDFSCVCADIKSLLHLGCAKIATLIKALDQNEINRIIEEEERYRREHAAAGGDGGADDAKADS